MNKYCEKWSKYHKHLYMYSCYWYGAHVEIQILCQVTKPMQLLNNCYYIQYKTKSYLNRAILILSVRATVPIFHGEQEFQIYMENVNINGVFFITDLSCNH